MRGGTQVKYRVLIVEDDANYRYAIREGIPWEKNGFVVVGEAIHGKQAMEILKTTEVDVLLTDVSMPLMNGVELTKYVCSKYPKIRVIVLSAYDNFHFVKESMKYGAKDYILKQEMRPDDVIELVKQICIDTEEKELETVKRENIAYELWDFFKEGKEVSEETKDGLFQILQSGVHCAAVVYCEKKKLTEVFEILKQNEDFLYVISDYENKILLFARLISGKRSNLLEQQRILASHIGSLSGVKQVMISRESSVGESRSIALMKDLQKLSEVSIWEDKDKFLFYEYEECLSYQKVGYVYRRNEKEKHPEDFIAWKEIEKDFQRVVEVLYKMLPDEQHLHESLYQYITEFSKVFQREPYAIHEFYEAMASRKYVKEKTSYILERLEQLWREKNVYTGKSPEIQKTLYYIQEHYSEELSLGKISEFVGLSNNYFSNLFKAEMNKNLTQYINELRISKAKTLLEKTNMKDYEVAKAVGYNNAAYFSTIFRKITKKSVSEYRMSVKNERNR